MQNAMITMIGLKVKRLVRRMSASSEFSSTDMPSALGGYSSTGFIHLLNGMLKFGVFGKLPFVFHTHMSRCHGSVRRTATFAICL